MISPSNLKTSAPLYSTNHILKTPFIRLPNYIITYSLTKNKFILPLYLYSAINASYLNSYTINTSFSLLSEIFAPTVSNAPTKFKEGFELLTQSDDCPQSFSLVFANHKTPDFPYDYSSIPKTAHIQYLFLDRVGNIDNGWTKFTYKEFTYILERITQINQTITDSNLDKSKFNTIELLNLYAYYKQRIVCYNNINKKYIKKYNNNNNNNNNFTSKNSYNNFHAKNNKLTMHESQDIICENTGLSRNTLTKYTNQLVELKLIKINKKQIKNNKSKNNKKPYLFNEYILSNEWESDFQTLV